MNFIEFLGWAMIAAGGGIMFATTDHKADLFCQLLMVLAGVILIAHFHIQQLKG